MRKILFLILFAAAACLSAAPKEKIAVADDNRANLPESDIIALTARIESKLNSEAFDVVSRATLNAILRENQFQTESGLVNDREALARFGKISGVNLLLHYTVSKLADRYSMTFLVVNCTTGAVDAKRKATVDARTFPELLGRLDIALDQMGLLQKGAEQPLKKLAILPVKIAAPNIPPQLAESFGVKLSGILGKSGSFELLDRGDLKSLLAESSLVDSVLADSGQYSKIAQMSVADYLLVLALTRLENNLVASGTEIAGVSTRQVSNVQVQFKLLEVKSGKVVNSGDFKYSMRSTEIPASEKRDWTPADYSNALLDRAASALALLIQDEADPVLVAAVDGNDIYLTRGSVGGIKTGDEFHVYVKSAPIVHPVTKKILGQSEKLAGTVRVTAVQPELSTARLASGKAAEIKNGAVCRRIPAQALPSPPPAYPKAQ